MHLIKTHLVLVSVIAVGSLLSAPLFAQQPTPNVKEKLEERAALQAKAAAASEAPKLRSGGDHPGGESRELAEARIELARQLAANDENHPAVVQWRTRIAMLEKLEPKKISIDFPGGPLSRLIETISSQEGVSFSVINAGEPGDFATELPAFTLRNANLRTVAAVVRSLLLARGLEFEAMDPEPNAIVGTVRRMTGRPGSPARTEFESFQLAAFLGQQSVDDVIGAIRAAWELDGRHDREALKLKFHPPTSLLLVAGPGEAIALTRNVLSQLKGAPSRDLIETDIAERRKEQVDQEVQRRRDSRERPLLREHPEPPPPGDKK